MTQADAGVQLPTSPTGTSLQRLADEAWARDAGRSLTYFEGQRWTSAELADRARRLCGGLRSAGMQPGDRVVICMANCPEVGIAYHAVWRAGAVATPVLFLLSEDELRHVLTDSGAVLIVTTPEFLPKVMAAASTAPALRGIVVAGAHDPAGDGDLPLLDFAALEGSESAPLTDSDPASMAALLYTGGTTGRSKGVMISHNALSAAAWAATATSSTDDAPAEPRTALLPLPLSHVYGLMVSTMSVHAPEPGVVVLMRWFDPAGWLRLAQEHHVSMSPLVPSMLQMLLQQPLEDYDLSALTRLNSGAAPLPQQVIDDFGRRLPHVEISEGYGCTESSAIIATSPVGRVKHGSVGLPAPGVQVRIELPDGSEAAAGGEGEICVRGAVLMSGYWHAAEETAQTLRGGWLHTGDVGRLDADGYLYIVDRIKDLIIRGGYNVYPRDVEDVLVQHPDVVSAAAVGRPDEKYGEEVVAFVQLVPGSSVTPAQLVEFARQRLSAVKYPREVRIVDAIPLTSVLKTDRKRLRAQLASETQA
ncbi:MAG TPA: AMP-binding protein [Streptosporangiaceae bacterium]|jgi:long-chain acyl-CoA synthetase